MNRADLPVRGFRVSGFRTLRDIEIQCDGQVIVVCGPNNSGKSSLLTSLNAYGECLDSARRSNPNLDLVKGISDGAFAIAVDPRSFAMRNAIQKSVQDLSDDQLNAALGELVNELPGGLIWIGWKIEGGKPQLDMTDVNGAKRVLEGLQRGNNRQMRKVAAAVLRLGGDRASNTINAQWIGTVLQRVIGNPEIRHISDVRRAVDEPLTDSDLGTLVVASGPTTDDPPQKREKWATDLELLLQDVFGSDVRYEARATEDGRGELLLAIDGEKDIPIEHVGAGVREVVAIGFQALSAGGADVLCIEEPENCLHPTAVRRLVRSLANRLGIQLFVSTHSAAVINGVPDSVVEVTRDGLESTARLVSDAGSRFRAVRSLGHLPADLVLTPCALWVEGPSDRLYLTTWLANEGLHEGIHYTVSFFGGSLGTHLSAEHEQEAGGILAEVRPLSRRCVLLADSDRDVAQGSLKRHVRRWREEVKGDNDAEVLWTWGREIENSLPLEAINALRVQSGLRRISEGRRRFARVRLDGKKEVRWSKIEFARRALELAGTETPEDARTTVGTIARFIRNSVESPP